MSPRHGTFAVCSALITMLACAPAVALADLAGVANAIRSQGCAARSGIQSPLGADAKLDRAARRLARGDRLQGALAIVGYRASRSASIRITNRVDEGAVASVLRKEFCEELTDAALAELGVFQRGNDAWIIVAARFSPPVPENAPAVGQRVLKLVNQARSKERRCGREFFTAAKPLRMSSALEHAARLHAQDMAAHSHMAHQGYDGSTPAERVKRAGYEWRAVGENVAAGATTPEQVVQSWLDSPGHCTNLMSPDFSEMGVAYVYDANSEQGIYWAQVFATPR